MLLHGSPQTSGLLVRSLNSLLLGWWRVLQVDWVLLEAGGWPCHRDHTVKMTILKNSFTRLMVLTAMDRLSFLRIVKKNTVVRLMFLRKVPVRTLDGIQKRSS